MKLKPYHLFLFFICVIFTSCASKIIFPEEIKTKADIEVFYPSKAIFFINKESALNLENTDHNKIGDEIYYLFGEITDQMLVGSTNAKTLKYTDKKNKIWFIDVEKMRQNTAMLIFDENKPFIEYKSNNYKKLVTNLFREEIENSNQNKVYTQKLHSRFLNEIDTLGTSEFIPDKNYANKLIKNSNNIYYPLPPFEEDEILNGAYQILSYSDTNKKEVISETQSEYKDNRLIKYKFKNDSNEIEITYYINQLGLLDSIQSISQNSNPKTTFFKYLPDRFITVIRDLNYYDEYILNSENQTIEVKSYRDTNDLVMKSYFLHDALGRILEEENYDDEGLINKTLFTYSSPRSNKYKTLTITNKNNNLETQIRRTYKNGDEILKNFQDDHLTYEIIYKLSKYNEGEIIYKDNIGNITLIEVQHLVKNST